MDPPTSPVIIKVVVSVARAVLKKLSAIRIPQSLGKPQSIITQPESMTDYRAFYVFIKTSCQALEANQNVVYFADYEEEHKFIFDIPCLWAICSGKTEITLVAVTLNSDLACRLVRWEKVSAEVTEDLIPPPPPTAKKQSIASMQASNIVESRHRAIEILNEESSMNFNGPIFQRNNDDPVISITIWKRYAPLLLSLNSLIFTIDNQIMQIGRTTPVDEKIVSKICKQILEEHSIDKEDTD